MDKHAVISALERAWANDARWNGITRPYNAGDVYRLRGSIDIEYSLARYGAARLWELLRDEDYVAVLSAITGNQAIQQVQAGLKAIYVSGWQVAADANHALEMYPDQSLYPSDSVPALLRRINNALKRADQIAHLKDDHSTYWCAPASTPPSPEPSPTRPMPTCCGSRRRTRTSQRRRSSPRRSTRSIRASCWRTTARRLSTGAST